jgi:PAS domain S-box-containing protein
MGKVSRTNKRASSVSAGKSAVIRRAATGKGPKASDRVELRSRAEAMLGPSAGGPSPGAYFDAQRITHELEVHRLELEMQNDELESARAATAVSLARYTELYDFAPIGYATLDEASVMVELNHACGRLLGGERGEFLYRRLSHMVAAGDRAAFRAFMLNIAQGRAGEVQACEVTLLRSSAPVRARLTATLCKEDGSILMALDDVTEQRRAEEAQVEAARRKDEFLSVLSHELRNPLAPIRVSLAVLERVDANGAQAEQARRVIERQIGHLTRLVDDLLDVARIASGKIRLQREAVEVGSVVRAAIEDQEATFAARGVTLEGRLSPELLWVNADSARVTQVLGNLLGNAAKFTPEGGRVQVLVDRVLPGSEGRPIAPNDRGSVAIRVRDNGVGISPEMLPHLFEPFMQAPQALDRSQGGLGLGLAMVRALIEQHGGSVIASSGGLGRGTEVTVRLPLVATQAITPRATQPPPAGPRSILIIEDNADLAEGLKVLLELFGHQVITAEEGSSGIHLARIHRPSLVLCDIGLPGMDGHEVAHAMRQDPALRNVYLVALSGYARPEDRQASVDAGFNEHIAKPPSVERLKQLLADAPSQAAHSNVGASTVRSTGSEHAIGAPDAREGTSDAPAGASAVADGGSDDHSWRVGSPGRGGD